MLIDVNLLHILQKADQGCPQCQYIMATYYFEGNGVPKNKQRAKHYYKLVADHESKDLGFIGECYSMLLLLIGYLDYVDNEDAEAAKYFNLTKSYIRANYPIDEAEKMIHDSSIEKYMSTIEL